MLVCGSGDDALGPNGAIHHHGPWPPAVEISVGPVIDVPAQPCTHEDCPLLRFSCYLRQNGGVIKVSKLEVLTSRLLSHIWCRSVEPSANSPKFTHIFTPDSHKFKAVNFRRIGPHLVLSLLCVAHIGY